MARMTALVKSLPDQLAEGAAVARAADLHARGKLHNVVIAGMGGSGIGGNLCRGLAWRHSRIPILLCNDYDLPAVAGPDSLVLAVSFSGATEETLSAYRHAVRRGCRVVAITSGGELEARARRAGGEVVKISGGMPPRAALGLLFSCQLVVLDRLGVLAGARDIAPTAAFLLRRSRVLQVRARRIARQLVGRLPIVYSTGRLLDAIADRWRCQLNENAGVLCHTSMLPEHNHNEIVGMGRPELLARSSVILALLDKETHPRVRLRLESVLEICRRSYQRAARIESEGSSRLARMLSLVMLGDFLSVELAGCLGKDPMEIKRIDMLKQRMAER